MKISVLGLLLAAPSVSVKFQTNSGSAGCPPVKGGVCTTCSEAGTAVCTAVTCVENAFDVDLDPSNGCEEVCPAVDGGVCVGCSDQSTCTAVQCAENMFDADGNASNGCEEGCPTVAQGTCTQCSSASTCAQVACEPNAFNTDGNASNGCEAGCPTVDGRTCTACSDPHTCTQSVCGSATAPSPAPAENCDAPTDCAHAARCGQTEDNWYTFVDGKKRYCLNSVDGGGWTLLLHLRAGNMCIGDRFKSMAFADTSTGNPTQEFEPLDIDDDTWYNILPLDDFGFRDDAEAMLFELNMPSDSHKACSHLMVKATDGDFSQLGDTSTADPKNTRSQCYWNKGGISEACSPGSVPVTATRLSTGDTCPQKVVSKWCSDIRQEAVTFGPSVTLGYCHYQFAPRFETFMDAGAESCDDGVHDSRCPAYDGSLVCHGNNYNTPKDSYEGHDFTMFNYPGRCGSTHDTGISGITTTHIYNIWYKPKPQQ